MTGEAAPAAVPPLEAQRALLRTVLFWMNQPPRHITASAWNGHLGFINALVGLARPGRIVELGVHRGGSFIALCDACIFHELATEVIGVDTWQGDHHVGKADLEATYVELRDLAARAWPFARLLREDFDAARRGVPDGSVDLLHIDGYHTLEAVSKDFSRWFSALSPRGICLFHDIAVRERNFGVHQLWDQLKERWPSLEFRHASGLGVLLVGGEQREELRAFLALWQGSPLAREAVRTAAELLASTFPARVREEAARRRVRGLERRFEALRRQHDAVTRSRLWRWSAPLRALFDRPPQQR